MTHNGSPRPGCAGHDESRLRALVRTAPGLTVLTGGQTGADTLAARAAASAGLPVHLIFPAGLRQEDGPLTAKRRRALAGATVHELSSPSFDYRTWTSVYVADVVILLDPAGGDGCAETARAAWYLDRPLLEPGTALPRAEDVSAWLAETDARVLMVAGCRASLLERHGQTAAVRVQAEAIAAGAAAVHARLTAAPWPS
ncbi:MAG: YpsA SLOG family protein [Streptosporangiaceae bacterium]|jgi:hypothetical protein